LSKRHNINASRSGFVERVRCGSDRGSGGNHIFNE
jgi:hypothetical protein